MCVLALATFYLYFLSPLRALSVAIVASHIVSRLLIGFLIKHCVVVFLALIALHPTPRAITTGHEVAQVFIAAEAVALGGSCVQALEHVLLRD
jgi:hypothetical protein